MFGDDWPAYYFFEPRPDQPDRLDQQTSFVEEKLPGVAFLVGGNGAGCAHRDQLIYDPVLNDSRKISEIETDFHVWSLTSDGRVVIARASKPQVYGVEKLYKVFLSNGRCLMVTLGHRVWTGQQWREIGDILREENRVLLPAARHESNIQAVRDSMKQCCRGTQEVPPSDELSDSHGSLLESDCRIAGLASHFDESPISVECSQRSSVDSNPLLSLKGESSWTRTPPDSPVHCCQCFRPCGEQPQIESGIDQGVSRQPVGVRGHIHCERPLGEMGSRQDDTHVRPCEPHRSMTHCVCRGLRDHVAEHASSGSCLRSWGQVGIHDRSDLSSISATSQMTVHQKVPLGTCRIGKAQSSVEVAKASRVGAARSCERCGNGSRIQLCEESNTPSPCGGETHILCSKPSSVANRLTTYSQSQSSSFLNDTNSACHELATGVSGEAFESSGLVSGLEGFVYITSIEYINEEEYWDFSVEDHENYWCEGVWNHNTTSAALYKVAKFLMETPPPRKDTPFWIIGNDLLQVCETVWKEKLWGSQFILRDELDMARVKWKNSKQGHALTVPLKPWEGQYGRNWQIEFKSCKQGRDQFQGRSIGGFLFVEQFPWEILQEAMARCREYSIPGSMMAEFTPIDPILSMRLQEMQENGHAPANPDPSRTYLPDGYKVYRANTACAMEAGHVREEWFHQFFGSMDPAEREVRLTGAWPSFEGQIYPAFNPFVHNISMDEVYSNDGLFPSGVFHRRAIDWGFSAEHAFVCLWGYWFPDTHSWVIYDEYYSTDQKKTVVEHLWNIADRHEWPEATPYFGSTYADPSRQDHIRIASRLNEYPGPDGKAYRRISIQNAANSVYEGIDHIRSQLTVHPADGKPRLRICRETCPNLWRQMQTYRWVKGSETGLNPRAGAREPLKKDDDSVDALRYLVFTDAKHCKINIQQLATAPSRAGRSVQFARGGKLQ